MRRIVSPAISLAGMLLALCSFARALDPVLDISQYAHTSWKIHEGFTKGTINAIAQTPDGYLWLGTEFGLLRFDGVRAVPWQPPGNQHLPSSQIFSLFASRNGTLWVGTAQGLASWKDGKLTQYPDLAGQYVFRLLEDRDGAVWVGATGIPSGRLCAIQNDTIHCDGADSRFGEGVYGLYEDGKGTLWVGVLDGLWRWRPGPPRFYAVPGSVDSIQAFNEDNDGALLIGTRRGILRFVDGTAEPYPLAGNMRKLPAKRLLRDREGSLWIGTGGSGIIHVHRGRTDMFSQADGLSGNDVSNILDDREGNIWVVTSDGLDRFREFSVTTLTEKQGLLVKPLSSVVADKDGGIWLGTNGGLNYWDHGQLIVPRTGSARLDGKLDGENPGSLFQDERGRIWISTYRKFGYLENGRFVSISKIPEGLTHSIAEDKGGALWIANQEYGLLQLLPGNVVKQIPWSRLGHQDYATVLAADPSRDGLWIGFFHGGVVYFADGKVQSSYSSSNGPAPGHVSDLRFDHNGALWMATDGGLSRLKDGYLATLTSKNGLPCETVNWVIEDDAHSFWLNMPCGLVRIAQIELDAWAVNPQRVIQIAVFDASDGVSTHAEVGGYTPQVVRSSDGKLWFAGPDGAGIIDPRHIALNKLPPPVHIEQITANHKSYDAAQRLRLPPLVRDLEIDYTALSLVVPGKVLFRYKLEGVDRDWQDVGNRREAFYTNLAPGTYQFGVIACNNSGVWNLAGDQLDFVIAPAWFQTNLFRVMCVAAFLLILWVLYQLRLRQLSHHFDITLEARVNERTRIARDLHDTLLQSFQGLTLHFQRARNLLPDRAAEAIETLDKALDGAEDAIVEGRDAIHDLRSPRTAAKALAEEIRALGEELVEKDTSAQEKPQFHLVIEGSAHPLQSEVHTDIFRIAREALRNAFGHSRGKLIETEMAYTQSQFRLRVRDDGKGIDPDARLHAERTGHLGLKGMRERAERLGGELEVWSEPGAGTEIELRVPASIAYEAVLSQNSSRQFWRQKRNR